MFLAQLISNVLRFKVVLSEETKMLEVSDCTVTINEVSKEGSDTEKVKQLVLTDFGSDFPVTDDCIKSAFTIRNSSDLEELKKGFKTLKKDDASHGYKLVSTGEGDSKKTTFVISGDSLTNILKESGEPGNLLLFVCEKKDGDKSVKKSFLSKDAFLFKDGKELKSTVRVQDVKVPESLIQSAEEKDNKKDDKKEEEPKSIFTQVWFYLVLAAILLVIALAILGFAYFGKQSD